MAGVEEALVTHLTCRDVVLEDADEGGLPARSEHLLREVVDGVVVVLEDAGMAGELLAEHHHRHVDRRHRLLVGRGEDGGDEDDAIDLVALGEHGEVVDLEFLVVVGVAENDLVAHAFEDLGDAVDHSIHGLRVKSGDDDAHEPGLARAQRLGVLRGDVACLVDDATDEIALLL